MVPTFKVKDYIGINGVGLNQLIHPHFEKWFDYIINEYEKPEKNNVIFLPCAAIKPYNNSPLHKKINEVLSKYENNLHKIVISNAGIIPYEFIEYYPFESYDWNPAFEDNISKELYYNTTLVRLRLFLKTHKYREYFSYLNPDSLSFKALKNACKTFNYNLHHPETIKLDYKRKDPDLLLIHPKNLDNLDNLLKRVIKL